MTTRDKGTGLGLAIVAKIFEDHGGGIQLRDAAEAGEGERGAWIRATFVSNGKAEAPKGAAPANVSAG